eukprot:6359600-Amphidinium_carterae.1
MDVPQKILLISVNEGMVAMSREVLSEVMIQLNAVCAADQISVVALARQEALEKSEWPPALGAAGFEHKVTVAEESATQLMLFSRPGVALNVLDSFSTGSPNIEAKAVHHKGRPAKDLKNSQATPNPLNRMPQCRIDAAQPTQARQPRLAVPGVCFFPTAQFLHSERRWDFQDQKYPGIGKPCNHLPTQNNKKQRKNKQRLPELCKLSTYCTTVGTCTAVGTYIATPTAMEQKEILVFRL